MTKNLDSDILKKYKMEWEGFIADQRRPQSLHIVQLTSREKELVKFEIKRTIYSLASRRGRAYTNRVFDYIYTYNLIEGHTTEILDELNNVNWLLHIKQIEILTRRTYELFWHFVDPDRVSMSKEEEKDEEEAIRLVGYFGFHAAIVDPAPDVFRNIMQSMKSFFEIGVTYNKKSIRRRALKELLKMRRSLKKESEQQSGAPAKSVVVIIDDGLRKMRKANARVCSNN